MIELTRLNGNSLFVNGDLIKWAEAAPDTTLTLINGEKVVVRESCSEVVERMTIQRIRLLGLVAGLLPPAGDLLRATSALGAARAQLHAGAQALEETMDESS